ncbi:MAG: hypothetical protein Q8904_15080 [Bacteroidota bacterium]|nr:hypothetical protein [Bacteroidota bacterium]
MSENLSPIEELLTALNSQTVKIIQTEMQKIQRRMIDMPTESWREQDFNLVAGVVADVYFNDTKPNYTIFTNYSDTEVLFIGTMANLSDTNFDFKVSPRSRIQWLWGRAMDHVYILGSGRVRVQSYAADFDPSAVVSYVY